MACIYVTEGRREKRRISHRNFFGKVRICGKNTAYNVEMISGTKETLYAKNDGLESDGILNQRNDRLGFGRILNQKNGRPESDTMLNENNGLLECNRILIGKDCQLEFEEILSEKSHHSSKTEEIATEEECPLESGKILNKNSHPSEFNETLDSRPEFMSKWELEKEDIRDCFRDDKIRRFKLMTLDLMFREKNYFRKRDFQRVEQCGAWLNSERYHWGGWYIRIPKRRSRFGIIMVLGHCWWRETSFKCAHELAIIVLRTSFSIVYEKYRHNHALLRKPLVSFKDYDDDDDDDEENDDPIAFVPLPPIETLFAQ